MSNTRVPKHCMKDLFQCFSVALWWHFWCSQLKNLPFCIQHSFTTSLNKQQACISGIRILLVNHPYLWMDIARQFKAAAWCVDTTAIWTEKQTHTQNTARMLSRTKAYYQRQANAGSILAHFQIHCSLLFLVQGVTNHKSIQDGRFGLKPVQSNQYTPQFCSRSTDDTASEAVNVTKQKLKWACFACHQSDKHLIRNDTGKEMHMASAKWCSGLT